MPDAPAGYSGTPLPTKLGIKVGSRVLLIDAPEGFEDTHLVPPVQPITLHRKASRSGEYDVVVAFHTVRAALDQQLPRDIARTVTNGALWICWPKRASKVDTDITEDVIRASALAAGVVDVKVCAVDSTWSGLKLVRRLRDR